jgi:hypothetical protein
MAVTPHDRFRQLATLFSQAVSLPAGPERDAFIESNCGTESGLRAELLRLLDSDAEA